MKELSLKEKDYITRTIYKNYQKAQLDILYMNQHYNYYPTIDLFRIKEPSHPTDNQLLHQLERKQKLEDYVRMIELIQSRLSKESYFFIQNEYLNFYDSRWWYYSFSRATYYRLKHRSVNEFMDNLSHFWDEQEIIALLK